MQGLRDFDVSRVKGSQQIQNLTVEPPAPGFPAQVRGGAGRYSLGVQ